MTENDDNNNTGENTEGKQPLQLDTWSQAFTHTGDKQALDYLASPGNDIKDLLMRTRFDSKRSEGSRKVIALARIIAKAKRFHCPEAEFEALLVAAGDVSEERRMIMFSIKERVVCHKL